jgi:hypothetical protein
VIFTSKYQALGKGTTTTYFDVLGLARSGFERSRTRPSDHGAKAPPQSHRDILYPEFLALWIENATVTVSRSYEIDYYLLSSLLTHIITQTHTLYVGDTISVTDSALS